MGTETPQRPRKEAAGSRHEPGLVRQTAPASTNPIGPQTQTLLEEVLRREPANSPATANSLETTCAIQMVALGLEAARARKATATGRGAWWNAGVLAHACGREQSLACGVGTPEPSDSTPGSAAAHLNRRVRNRTHGGVGGREG